MHEKHSPMPVFYLNEALEFPPVEWSEPDGLLALGGDLSVERLKLAYQNGIFPWYDRKPIMWWSPDPRFVLFPDELVVSTSMRKILARRQFDLTLNQAFGQVIRHCATAKREGQQGTWITRDMEKAYIQLHKEGWAVSAEAWQADKLVGGLYGIRLGKVFCGESMFSLVPNASKAAFLAFVPMLQAAGVQLIDCQVHTTHLESLGAKMISRKSYLEFLR